jgi:hypothetical protein
MHTIRRIKNKDKFVFVHAMRNYGRSGGISPFILNLSNIWRCVFSFTSLVALPTGKKSPVTCSKRLSEGHTLIKSVNSFLPVISVFLDRFRRNSVYKRSTRSRLQIASSVKVIKLKDVQQNLWPYFLYFRSNFFKNWRRSCAKIH